MGLFMKEEIIDREQHDKSIKDAIEVLNQHRPQEVAGRNAISIPNTYATQDALGTLKTFDVIKLEPSSLYDQVIISHNRKITPPLLNPNAGDISVITTKNKLVAREPIPEKDRSLHEFAKTVTRILEGRVDELSERVPESFIIIEGESAKRLRENGLKVLKWANKLEQQQGASSRA